MNYSVCVQNSEISRLGTVLKCLDDICTNGNYDTAQIAMAYVSIAGVRHLLDIVDVNDLVASQWLLGLSDAVTQPHAIKICQKINGAQVYKGEMKNARLRFHPKIIYLSSSTNDEAVMLVGSANLTQSGLYGNAEAVVQLKASSAAQKRDLDSIWSDIWAMGSNLTDADFTAYEKLYKKKKARRPKTPRQKMIKKPKTKSKFTILQNDDVDIDPSLADVCWIECGKITAAGRELEFKAEQGLFFGLDPQGHGDQRLQFKLSNGQTASLRMKFRGNHMWRLEMTANVPEVARGLRPRLPGGGLGRSPWVAVFTRDAQNNQFELKFVGADTAKHNRLRTKSKNQGTYGKTSAREYGWY